MNDWSDGWTKEGVWVSLTKLAYLDLLNRSTLVVDSFVAY